ncbi:M48 family metallopeptidase [Lachnospiraceae bacterium OttesenSCG-928-E19]|nr:M48 family metallopeptidase [Lachnospiraceae bacterium OttesenSCG-928-E19]
MTDYIFTLSNGEEIPVIIETKRGARNMTIRPKIAGKREIRISKPWLVSTTAAVRFLNQKASWVERVFARAPQKSQIQDGDVIEFLGKKITVRHDPSKKSNGYDPNGPNVLIIGGAVEFFERRTRDFIKDELLKTIKNIIKTTPSEFHPKRLCLRDTTSRWGSCSSTGAISFSWRLAFAPLDVMRYVVMHELAHRKYMDHSVDFWATVSHLYGDGVGRAKRWLSQHGNDLHQYF